MNKTINQKKVFENFLKKEGFNVSTDILLQGTVSLIPTAKKTPEGDTILISGIHVAVWEGSDTPKNGLGCISFNYTGVKKKKYCKNSYQSKILKKVKVYDNVGKAIREYRQWRKNTKKILCSYKTIIGTY